MSQTAGEQFDALPLSEAREQGSRAVLAEVICETARLFAHRGWALAGGGHFSVVLRRDPMRLLITPDKIDKATLQPDDCRVLEQEQINDAWPQAQLHYLLVRHADAGAVIATQSPAALAASEHWASQSGLTLEGYDLLRQLPTEKPTERLWLPVLSQSISNGGLSGSSSAAERQLIALLKDSRQPAPFALLIRRCGLVVWGADLAQARRHSELFETLLATIISRNALK